MAAKKYRVALSQKQRKKLKSLSRRGKVNARKLTRARILLLADENRPKGPKTDALIADLLDSSPSTIVRVRKQFVTLGLDAALEEKPRSGRPVKFSGAQRAAVTAIACSVPPDGYGKWSLRLMADKLVQLDYVETISHETVGVILKKTNFPPTSRSSGVLAN